MAASTPSTAQLQAMDNVQAMTHLVLVSSGRYLRAKQMDRFSAMDSHTTLERIAEAAFERFHLALDDLEGDIVQAQAVLRRDVALHRADRSRREAAAEEQARLAAHVSAVTVPATPAPPAQSPKLDMSTTSPPAPAPADDVPMDTAHKSAGPDAAFDFDALFGDTDMHNSADDVHSQPATNMDGADDANKQPPADVDTADHVNNQPDIDTDTSIPDVHASLDKSTPSLLRDLEDFANGGSDDNAPANPNLGLDLIMPSQPDMATSASQEQPSSTLPPDTVVFQPTMVNNDFNMDTITSENFDDLFDLEYQNPEATQFDDAFFGLDA